MIQGVTIILVQLTLVIAAPEFYSKDNCSYAKLERSDDDASIAIPLSPSLPFYGCVYQNCIVSCVNVEDSSSY